MEEVLWRSCSGGPAVEVLQRRFCGGPAVEVLWRSWNNQLQNLVYNQQLNTTFDVNCARLQFLPYKILFAQLHTETAEQESHATLA